MPGLVRPAAKTRASDQRWIGSRHALEDAITGTLKVSDFTAGTHYPNGYFPSGLPVNAADPANLKPYTGGAGEVLRFLKDTHQVVVNDAGDKVTDIQVAMLWHGLIKTAFVPGGVTPASANAADTRGFTFVAGA